MGPLDGDRAKQGRLAFPLEPRDGEDRALLIGDEECREMLAHPLRRQPGGLEKRRDGIQVRGRRFPNADQDPPLLLRRLHDPDSLVHRVDLDDVAGEQIESDVARDLDAS